MSTRKDGFMFLGESDYDTLILDGHRISECVEYINREKIIKLYISSTNMIGNNLEFLIECTCLEELYIEGDKITDFNPLYLLPKLRVLSILGQNGVIDLSAITSLIAFSGIWDSRLININKCHNLNYLALTKYKCKSGNLEEFSSLQNLRTFRITQAQIKSLKGCRSLKKLETFELYHLKNLELLDELPENAIMLDINTCKKLKNYDVIARLKKLETLRLMNCGEINSLIFIKDMPKLRNISFVDTTVVDGDLSPCIGLDFVGFLDKKHYSHKFKDLNPTFIS